MASSVASATREIAQYGKLTAAALVSVPEGLRQMAESQLELNRRLIPFSGKLGAAFAGLEYGDQMRNFRLARSVEESALTLARQMNAIREGMAGMTQFQMAITNRLGIAAAALVGPGFREVGEWGRWGAQQVYGKDPNGNAVEDAINALHENLAGLMGGLAQMPPNGVGFAKGFEDAMKQAQRDRQAAAMLQNDAWTGFINKAQGLPPLQLARPFVSR